MTKSTNVLICDCKYFLDLQQSCGDNRLWLRFSNETTIFIYFLLTGWVKHMHICLEDTCNLPQLSI